MSDYALQKKPRIYYSVIISSAAAANAVMLGGGYFNPLTGYMNAADALSIAENMKTTIRSILAHSHFEFAKRYYRK